MGDPIRNSAFGIGGVNLVKDPLKLDDSEATQLQNAEVMPDEATGGSAALRQRGGLAALNSSPLAGAVSGIVGWPLRTTFARTVYAAKGTEDSNTFRTSTNGTTWANNTTAAAAADDDKYQDEANERAARRMVGFRSFILYPGNGYTQDTDDPIVVLWDGSASVTVASIKYGPSSNAAPPFAITDMLVANGKLYLAIHDAGGTAPNLSGRVLSLNLDTGQIKQIASSFGSGTGEMAGGAPSALAYYLGQLWVGLNTGRTNDAEGKIVRCYPDVDTTWTSDVANLSQSISSLGVFLGDLYACTYSSAATAERIYQRSRTAGTYTARFTGAGSAGNGVVASFIVFGGVAFAVEYHATAPTIHIITSTDGTTWTTSRDVDATDSGVANNLPGQAVLHNSALLIVFRSTDADNNDGFIMRLASGTWTKVDTDNFSGQMSVLVQKTA